MRILFTGASSFTGYWFVRELSCAGHEIIATFTKEAGSYSGIKKKRIDLIPREVTRIFSCPFGSSAFMDIIDSKDGWDVLCHHAAETSGYKNIDFDYVHAIAQNTFKINDVLKELAAKECSKIVVTGSFFEPGEGAGDSILRAFSPYGVAKKATADLFEYFAQRHQMAFGKFVIPNPFGPLEGDRFTSYLMGSWIKGEISIVKTPDYVRDNIHVSILALAYSEFVGNKVWKGSAKFNPSGYVESQKDFTLRVSRETSKRLGLSCQVEFLQQKDFSEPLKRFNTDPIYGGILGWDESRAWDEMVNYYRDLEIVNY